jgi:hypothetical protein
MAAHSTFQPATTADCEDRLEICKIYTRSFSVYAVATEGKFLFTFRKGNGDAIEVYKAQAIISDAGFHQARF